MSAGRTIFTDGFFTYRTCKPGDESCLHASGTDNYSTVISNLSGQLELDEDIKYQEIDAKMRRRVVICEQDGINIGVVEVTFRNKGKTAIVTCNTVKGRCEPEEVRTMLTHALEWLRSVGVTRCSYTAKIRDDADGFASTLSWTFIATPTAEAIPAQLNDADLPLRYRN